MIIKLMIKNAEDPKNILRLIRERRRKIKSREARLGDLARVDLEEEFNDENIH